VARRRPVRRRRMRRRALGPRHRSRRRARGERAAEAAREGRGRTAARGRRCAPRRRGRDRRPRVRVPPRGREPLNAARLIAEEDARWRELHAVLDGIAPDRLERPGVTPEGWSVKDTIFHVAAWMADCADQLERMRFGTFVDPLETVQGIDQLNREWFELSRTLDVATVWTELFAAHA